MMLSFFLLFLLCDCTVTQESTTEPMTANTNNSPKSFTESLTTSEVLYPPELEAEPDYPVTAGQKVNLHCKAHSHVILERLEIQTWINVSRGGDLTLTEPSESGVYRCHSRIGKFEHVSPDHRVLIISTHATVAENLGIAAFFLSLLALILNFVILYRLTWQRPGNTPTTSNTAEKGIPKPEKSTKGALPKTDSDEVYMNYTSTNQAYTDLTPSNMTEENVYSSLS